MINLLFQVKDQSVINKTPSRVRVVAKSKNIYYAEFVFSPMWEGLARHVQFSRTGVETADVLIVDGAAQIPAAFLEQAGTVTVSVYGGNLATTVSAEFEVEASDFDEDAAVPLEDPDLGHAYVQTPTDSTGVEYIKRVDGVLIYYNGDVEIPLYDAYEGAVAWGYEGTKDDFYSTLTFIPESAASALEAAKDLVEKTTVANEACGKLEDAMSEARTTRSSLNSATSMASSINRMLGETVEGASATIRVTNTAKAGLENVISTANRTNTDLSNVTVDAVIARSNLERTIDTAATSKTGLEDTVGSAEAAKSQLQTTISSADAVKGELSKTMNEADLLFFDLLDATSAAQSVLPSLTAEAVSAASNLEQLRDENFNSQEILAGVADIRAYLGLSGDDILGLQVDYKNKVFTRLAGAAGLSAGADFDPFPMFGGRRRCNVADDGTILAYYGDEGYIEDGSKGQVMVYQPKFYYLVCPVEYDPIETGIGYHLRKANYYVSSKARAGFRLHPAFYDAAGNQVDYILLSAYEGSVWDADGGEEGTGTYITDDYQNLVYSADKLCSIAGVKPASGINNFLTRPNIEQLAQNRGAGWHVDIIKAVAANQLLMMIEMGMMNMQTAIGQGITDMPNSVYCNAASLTGSTAALGNATGQAQETINEQLGVRTVEVLPGRVSVTYRGMENPWGNIYKIIEGINVYGNGSMGGGQPFICKNLDFAEATSGNNYIGAGFTLAGSSGYISAMGYSTDCDWLFMASETLGSTSLPVGDYAYPVPKLNGYRVAMCGGYWSYGSPSGPFFWHTSNADSACSRLAGGRLVHVPTAAVD